MNDRIKKLAELATSYEWNGNSVTEELDTEKFAELIVKECIQMARDEQQRYLDMPHRNMAENAITMDNFQMMLREHFGVEL